MALTLWYLIILNRFWLDTSSVVAFKIGKSYWAEDMEVVSIKHLNTKEQDGTYPLKTKFFETINIGSNVQANGNASLLRAV